MLQEILKAKKLQEAKSHLGGAVRLLDILKTSLKVAQSSNKQGLYQAATANCVHLYQIPCLVLFRCPQDNFFFECRRAT